MNSIADSKWSEQKEEHLESKTKSCQPRRKTSQVEGTFQESASQEERLHKWKEHFKKPYRNHWQTYPKNYQWPTRYQTRKVYRGRFWCSIEKKLKEEKLQNTSWCLENKKIW